MLPVGKGKNYSRFHEFRKIICLLQTSLKQPVFHVDINNNGISCNCYAKIS